MFTHFFDMSNIEHGLNLCLSCTIFSYNKSVCQQTFGTPIRSCISAFIAKIYMEHPKSKAITTFHSPPILWLVYVDDAFCVLNKQAIKKFYLHLNSICAHLVYYGRGVKSSIAILNVMVSRIYWCIKKYFHQQIASLYVPSPQISETRCFKNINP